MPLFSASQNGLAVRLESGLVTSGVGVAMAGVWLQMGGGQAHARYSVNKAVPCRVLLQRVAYRFSGVVCCRYWSKGQQDLPGLLWASSSLGGCWPMKAGRVKGEARASEGQ